MRYGKGHKEASRKRILEVAAKRFRKEGFAEVGIAGVMSDSGLTSGAFYAHFKSKEALVRDVLRETLDARKEALVKAVEAGVPGLQASIRSYLSPEHRDSPEQGCPTAALVAEVARHPRATRSVYAARLVEFFDLMASQFTDPSEEVRRQQAASLFAFLVGTLQIARIVPEKAQSDAILTGGIETALSMLEQATRRVRAKAG